MRTETRERPKTEDYNIYIADDGTELLRKVDCENYEFLQEKNKRQMTSIECVTIDDERRANLWYIHNKEEFEWLCKTAWAHTDVYGCSHFKTPGWYIAIYYDSGDYRDYHEIYLLDEYIKEYQNKIDELKRLTSFENMV